MRFILKTIVYCLFILLIGCLFRGPIFRTCIQYTRVGDRPTLLITNRALQQTIEQVPIDQDADIETMVQATLTLSNQYLHFSGQRKSQDPNQMLEDGRANCIGYAAFFASVLTYILQKRHQQDQFEVKHLIGKLDFWGYDLHQISNDPFYKDHDYNVITNIKTGKKSSLTLVWPIVFGLIGCVVNEKMNVELHYKWISDIRLQKGFPISDYMISDFRLDVGFLIYR